MNRVLGSKLETGECLLVTQVLVAMHEEGVNTALAELHLPQVVAARIHAAKRKGVSHSQHCRFSQT